MTRLGSLPVDHQRFIEMFVLAGGSLKEIAERTGVSYPTVRSRLDKVIDALREEIPKRQRTKGTLLDALGPAKPEEAVATSGNGAVPNAWLGIAAKVIVWVPCATVKVWATIGAAA